MSKVPMTRSGEEKLRAELEELKNVKRPNIIAAISEARAHGDLKENAEYHAAKENQSFIEGRIQEIESKLSNAHIIDITQIENTGKVIFGVTVTLENSHTGETVVYTIVGDDESNPAAAKISYNTPIAKALIGKFEGDDVKIHIPSGEITYSIISVAHETF